MLSGQYMLTLSCQKAGTACCCDSSRLAWGRSVGDSSEGFPNATNLLSANQQIKDQLAFSDTYAWNRLGFCSRLGTWRSPV